MLCTRKCDFDSQRFSDHIYIFLIKFLYVIPKLIFTWVTYLDDFKLRFSKPDFFFFLRNVFFKGQMSMLDCSLMPRCKSKTYEDKVLYIHYPLFQKEKHPEAFEIGYFMYLPTWTLNMMNGFNGFNDIISTLYNSFNRFYFSLCYFKQ